MGAGNELAYWLLHYVARYHVHFFLTSSYLIGQIKQQGQAKLKLRGTDDFRSSLAEKVSLMANLNSCMEMHISTVAKVSVPHILDKQKQMSLEIH